MSASDIPTSDTAASGSGDHLAAELTQVRLESDTLYEVIRLIASSLDVDRVLDGLVGLLTKATRCHACFVYLRREDHLRLRAASSLYAQLVGQLEFGVKEGLAGWVVRNNKPAFIRDNAAEDPRTNYIAELEEERFQSMVAVPIPSRGGIPMGVIILHTIAPREFDEGTLNLLSHTAPLLAGAIENAQLYEDARRRVASLTALSTLSHQIAAVVDRESLYRTATYGMRALIRVDEVRLYILNEQRLDLVFADPPLSEGSGRSVNASGVLLELLQHRGRRTRGANAGVQNALGLDSTSGRVAAVPVAAGEEHLGILVAVGGARQGILDDAEELMRAVANQLATALKQAELIEKITEENLAHELFQALELNRFSDAEARAQQARCNLARAHVVVQMNRPDVTGSPWPQLAEEAERTLRRLAPGTLCDVGGERLLALLPLASGGTGLELQQLDNALGALSKATNTACGRSNVHLGVAAASVALREAADAAEVARALHGGGSAMTYGELGAYRYLIHLAPEEGRTDPYLDAVGAIVEYDDRRGSQLLATLEQYLADRRSVTRSARALVVHPNTLRQRLDRIESLSGIDLASEDLLALELAVKLARLRRRQGAQERGSDS